MELVSSQPRLFSQMRNLNMQRFVLAKFLQKFSQMRFLGLMLLEYLCAKPHVCPKGFSLTSPIMLSVVCVYRDCPLMLVSFSFFADEKLRAVKELLSHMGY